MSQNPQQEIFPPSRSVSSPDDAGAQQGSSDGSRTNILNVGQLHWHGNDIAELAKLASIDPELARRVVDQRDNEDKRANISYRFGVAAAVLLVGIIIFACSFLFVKVGIWSTLLTVALAIAVALLVRVILTGQWSDTTWFGRLVDALTKMLGSNGSE